MVDAIRILIFEDNPQDIRLLRIFLAEVEGFLCTLEHAQTLAEGHRLLAAEHFDAILLDLNLPDSEGLTTLISTRKKAPETPILLLTGFSDLRTAVQAVRYGAQDYLVKGKVDGDSLSRAIRYAIERNRAEQQIKDLSRRVLEIQEEERGRIARAIHDELGQDLFALKLQIQTIFQGMHVEGLKIEQGKQEVMEGLNGVIEQVRRLARNLSPAFMESAGLPLAVQRLAETFEMGGALRVYADVDELDGFFPNNWDINLYRILHEALLNVVRHADASEVWITARRKDEETLSVSVRDNGKGFQVQETMDDRKGLGLMLMDERTRLLEGKFDIRSIPGSGTEVYLEVQREEIQDRTGG